MSRLPARLEVGALLRQVATAGGFATVVRKGEPDAGAILVVLTDRGAPARLFERMPHHDGSRVWTMVRTEVPGEPQAFADYLERRGAQDPDLWIVELDIADGERFIGFPAPQG